MVLLSQFARLSPLANRLRKHTKSLTLSVGDVADPSQFG